MFMTIKLSVIMLLCLSYFTWNAHEAEAQHQREENVTRRRGTRYNVTWNKNSRRRNIGRNGKYYFIFLKSILRYFQQLSRNTGDRVS
ncbi:uncharacterized protein LOC119180317 isoform X2 [Rhipicephalus microplus]|uniref:uncharacterized protein LOC119180317 isoform X2 n=1 Tax=Rhipicephalus microplus TaxID=6941 RepID=UPI003F6ADE3C